MEIDLSRAWNGRRAPPRHGGRAVLGLRPGRLELSWDLRMAGEPRIPNVPAGFTDALWEWDVVELFLGAPDVGDAKRPRYLEVEVGPGGHWLVLGFEGVRERAAELRDVEPLILGQAGAGRWRGHAELPLSRVEAWAGPPPWRGLVAAVVGGPHDTGADGRARVHLCWPSLPGERLDFHQPSDWASMQPRTTSR